MTIINGFPVSQQIWHAKEHSLLNGHECREKVKIWSQSPVKVMSPYEWKISSCGVKPPKSKDTNLIKLLTVMKHQFLQHYLIQPVIFLLPRNAVFRNKWMFFYMDISNKHMHFYRYLHMYIYIFIYIQIPARRFIDYFAISNLPTCS